MDHKSIISIYIKILYINNIKYEGINLIYIL
jgi:hypothetical protein